MFIFLNPFRIYLIQFGLKVSNWIQKVSSHPENQQSFILFIYFSHYKIWKILGCDSMTIYETHAYDCLVLGCLILFIYNCPSSSSYMNSLVHATPVHPSICHTHILLFATIVTTTFVLLPPLL